MRGPVAKTTTCRACGRDFERFCRSGFNSYCKRCTARADKEIAKTLSVDCKECGKAFPARMRTVRYCSDKCRAAHRIDAETRRRRNADPEKRAIKMARARAHNAARRARERGGRKPPRAGRDATSPRSGAKAAEPRPCALCGRSFAPPGGRGRRPVHCRRCAARADRKIGRERTLNCKECGARFSTPKRNVRYCSKACSADSRRRATLERYHRRMADPEKRALAAARRRAQLAANRAREKGRGRRPDA